MNSRFFNALACTRTLALFAALLGNAGAQNVEPGSKPALAADEGLALFDINSDIELKRIRLDRIGSFFSFPKMEDLAAGKYTRLLRLPAGDYEFTKFETAFGYWQFDGVRNSKFHVEPGKINYVGVVRFAAGSAWGYRSLAIENSALNSMRNLERDYPGMGATYPWHYTGESPDPYLEQLPKSDLTAKEFAEEVTEPKIEDRDAAEIMFRSFSAAASGLSPDGRFVLETVSEGENVALHLIDLNSTAERVIYTGVPVATFWINSQTLALTFNAPRIQSRLLRIKSVSDAVEIPLAEGWVAGVVPGTDQIILAANGLKVIDVNRNLDRKSIRAAPHLRPGTKTFADWWIDGKGTLRLIELPRKAKQEYAEFVYFDVDTDKRIEFKLQDEKNEVLKIVGFGADSEILVLTNKDRNEMELAEFDPHNATLGKTVLSKPNADLQSVIWGVNHQVRAAAYLSKGRLVELSLADEKTDALNRKLALSLPDRNISIAGTASDGRRLVYVEGATEPGSAYIYQPASDKLELLTLSAPHLDGRPLAPTERFFAKASDGFEIESFLTSFKSDMQTKMPLLVVPHGGPFEVVDHHRFDKEVQYFAKLGFAVLQVNFRGSGGSGKGHVELGIKQWGDLMISDIESSVTETLKRFPIDETRIAALGTSYGGYGAIRLGQKNPARYKAVVGICGVYDLPLLFNSGLASRKKRGVEWLVSHVGDPVEDQALLIEQSPAYGIENFEPSVLLVHDRGDAVAPFEHAIRMQLALARAGKKIEFISVNDNNHGLVRAGTAIATYPKIARFLRKALLMP
jgi:dipeptidyl aminopeptidase/acylaminoacyl peptidase